MLMILGANVLSHKGSSGACYRKLFLLLWALLVQDIKPNIGHQRCKVKSVTLSLRSVGCNIFSGSGKKSNILGCNHPALDFGAVGNLDILSISLESFENLNL